MTRRREQKAIAHMRGIVHQLEGVKGKPTPDLLERIKQSAIDARDILALPDPDEQRFWTAVLTLGQVAEVQVRKVFGREMRVARVLNHEVYQWALCEVLRLTPAMLRAA
jgi:hypothetical protein